MDYTQIINHAWLTVKKNRFLWWLGLIALFTESSLWMSASRFYELLSNSPADSPIPTTPDFDQRAFTAFHYIPRVLGASTTSGSSSIIHSQNYNHYLFIIIIAFSAILLIGLIYISLSAVAGLIISVNSIEKADQSLGFATAYRTGNRYAWRLLGMRILIQLGLGISLFVLILPIYAIFSYKYSPGTIAITTIYTIFALIIFLIILAYLSVLRQLSTRSIVLHNDPVLQSLSSSVTIINHKIYPIITAWIISAVISSIYSILVILALLIISAILIAIGYAIFVATHTIGLIIFILISSIALIIALLFASSFFTAFISAYWTLFYHEIIKLLPINTKFNSDFLATSFEVAPEGGKNG